MRYGDPDDSTNMQRLISRTLLLDASMELGIGDDRIDKVLYRSGGGITLTADSYVVETERFTDEEGAPLSDHDAISVLFSWAKK
jgi:hypothetical protein